MKIKSIFVFTLSVLLLTSFNGCSKDNNNSDSYETSSNISSNYKQVLKDIDSSKKKLAQLLQEAKVASGGKASVLQEQISRENKKLTELQLKKQKLESMV